MKFTKNMWDNVALFGAGPRREVKEVSETQLNELGAVFTSYGIAEGEYVQFPDRSEMKVVSQPTRDNGDRLQYFVGVARGRDPKNLSPSYLSLGSLVRQDADRKFTCKFTEAMAAIPSIGGRLDHLQGKTIYGKESVELPATVFERGAPKRDENDKVIIGKGKYTIIEEV